MAENTTAIEGFCGEKFWDWELTWYTDNPDLTQCFQNTALLWFSCAFLWVFSPYEVYCFVHSKYRDIPWNILNISKCITNILLLVIQIADFWYSLNWTSNGQVFSVGWFTPAIKFLTLMLALCLMVVGKRRGIRSSGVLFFFFLILVATGAVMFRTYLYRAFVEDEVLTQFPFVTFMVYYPLVVTMLFLNCWADAEPRLRLVGEKSEKPCPEESASFLSKITFSWVEKTIWKGYKRPLTANDMWDLKTEHKTRHIFKTFDKHYQNSLKKAYASSSSAGGDKASFYKNSENIKLSKGKRKNEGVQVSILPAIWYSFGASFVASTLMKMVLDTLSFVSPQILRLLIEFVEDNSEIWKGYFYAVLLFGISMLLTFLNTQYVLFLTIVGMKMKAALTSAIYRKALRMSSAAKKESTVGEIVNLMAVDTQRLMDVTLSINFIWSAPYQIILALYFLWQILGPSVLAGLAVMVLTFPVNSYMGKKARTYQVEQMKLKDSRVKMMNELLSGMKVLKLYAWEPSFQQQVLDIRKKEIKVLKNAAILNAILTFIWLCAPYLVTLASFATYVLVDESHVLNATTIFVSLSLFGLLQMPMGTLPFSIIALIQANVSLKRLNKFMNNAELSNESNSHTLQKGSSITVEDGTFMWTSEDGNTLRNINWDVKEGSLVAIVGSVGSGKSSILSAVLGEMEQTSGSVNLEGSIAYASQLAWIQNATVQDNILFGKAMNKAKYDEVVECCALKPDLEMLPGGDQTEIGEKGINLSGGQKQRVSLARAVYNDADVYLLDDPLSAVDSHVGKHIFEKVIGPEGILKKKTRVLVTHGITYLPQMDHVMVLKDGEVSEGGTYKELLEKKGDFADFIMQHLTELEEDEEEELNEIKEELIRTIGVEEFKRQISHISRKSYHSESHSDTSSIGEGLHRDGISVKRALERRKSSTSQGKPEKETSRVGEKLIEEENPETKGVKIDVYIYYLKACGLWLTLSALLLHVAYDAFLIGSNIWLSVWSEKSKDGLQDSHSRDMFLGVYGALGFGQAATQFGTQLVMVIGSLHAASAIHEQMLSRIIRCPMSFFDTTPIGRIVNRFGKDIDTADSTLPAIIRMWFYCIFTVISTIVVISYTTPIFIVVIVPICIVYYFIQRLFLSTSRQLQRLESVSRSPIYSHFGETVTGTSTIRAFRQQERFNLENEVKVDGNQIYFYTRIIANRYIKKINCPVEL